MFRNSSVVGGTVADPSAKRGQREVWTSQDVEPRRPEMFIRKLIRDKKGATAIEYGLIAVSGIKCFSTYRP